MRCCTDHYLDTLLTAVTIFGAKGSSLHSKGFGIPLNSTGVSFERNCGAPSVGSITKLDSLRRRANARNVSFGVSLQWPIPFKF